jgi:hypothetical protein
LPRGAAVLSLHGAHAAAHRAAFTIEEVMQAPFPSSLTAAPRGNAVAWVFDMRGSRNVWIADVPNEIHNLARYASWMEFSHAADGYFEQHLERRAMVKPQ